MRYVPLLLIPFLLYNVFAFVIFGDANVDFREATMFSMTMASGAIFSLTVSAAIILMALLLLGVEVVKATRISSGSVVDHILAVVLFVLFLLEFIFVAEAATSTFVVLMGIALVDLICGFAVSLNTASRDVNFNA